MTKQDEKISPQLFDSDIKLAIRMLKTDAWSIGRLIAFAKQHCPDKELEIRRELRPIAVGLLYEVIGNPQTFAETISEIEEQEDEHGK